MHPFPKPLAAVLKDFKTQQFTHPAAVIGSTSKGLLVVAPNGEIWVEEFYSVRIVDPAVLVIAEAARDFINEPAPEPVPGQLELAPSA